MKGVFGWVIVDKAGNCLQKSEQLFFPNRLQTAHIYLKELHAVLVGIRAVQTVFPNVKKVILVCDNSAVIGSVKRRYSSNMTALTMLSEISMEVHMISVPSAWNVADAPSRNWPFDVNCLEKTCEAIRQDAIGNKVGFAGKYQDHLNLGGIRHEEPPDESGYCISLDCLEVGECETSTCLDEGDDAPLAPIA